MLTNGMLNLFFSDTEIQENIRKMHKWKDTILTNSSDPPQWEDENEVL